MTETGSLTTDDPAPEYGATDKTLASQQRSMDLDDLPWDSPAPRGSWRYLRTPETVLREEFHFSFPLSVRASASAIVFFVMFAWGIIALALAFGAWAFASSSFFNGAPPAFVGVAIGAQPWVHPKSRVFGFKPAVVVKAEREGTAADAIRLLTVLQARMLRRLVFPWEWFLGRP